MGKTTGFLEYERKDGPVRKPEIRTADFLEFHDSLKLKEQQLQGARCMDCGIPFCQAGAMISGMASGCPLHNLVPEINDLVYRGKMEAAYRRLSVTHSFPEFTCRVCPALCEAACTCGLHDAPVSTRENEKAVIEYAFENGLVEEEYPKVNTVKKVAVVGSGPSGLAAAQLLRMRGHEVTVYERSDRTGGLLRYGIPNMKLDKSLIDRRIRLMEKAGIRFLLSTDVGKDVPASELLDSYDSVILACGASNPRDISVPGRDAKGIRFAVDFLFACLLVRMNNLEYMMFSIRNALTALLTGGVIPFAALPWGLGAWLELSPLGTLAGAPLALMSGLGDPARLIGAQLFWNAVLWPLALWGFRASRERMVSYGG